MASEAELDAFTEFLFHLMARFKDGQRIDDFHAETVPFLASSPPCLLAPFLPPHFRTSSLFLGSQIAPVKLFYPRWWLETVHYLVPKEEEADVEGLPSPVAAIAGISIGALLMSNIFVAFLAIGTTLVVAKKHQQDAEHSSDENHAHSPTLGSAPFIAGFEFPAEFPGFSRPRNAGYTPVGSSASTLASSNSFPTSSRATELVRIQHDSSVTQGGHPGYQQTALSI